MIKTEEKPLNEIVDLMLASEYAEETRKDAEIGIDKGHFSLHSVNLDIIYEFPLDREFINTHPELKKALQEEFEDYLRYTIASDLDYFEAWLYGGKVSFGYDDYESTLKEELMSTYRDRITETHQCSQCGTEISEKYSRRHPQSLHRIGHRVSENPERYDWKIYCKACYDKNSGWKQ